MYLTSGKTGGRSMIIQIKAASEPIKSITSQDIGLHEVGFFFMVIPYKATSVATIPKFYLTKSET